MSRGNPQAPPDPPPRPSPHSAPAAPRGRPAEPPLQRLLPWVDLFYKVLGMIAALVALWRVLHG